MSIHANPNGTSGGVARTEGTGGETRREKERMLLEHLPCNYPPVTRGSSSLTELHPRVAHRFNPETSTPVPIDFSVKGFPGFNRCSSEASGRYSPAQFREITEKGTSYLCCQAEGTRHRETHGAAVNFVRYRRRLRLHRYQEVPLLQGDQTRAFYLH